MENTTELGSGTKALIFGPPTGWVASFFALTGSYLVLTEHYPYKITSNLDKQTYQNAKQTVKELGSLEGMVSPEALTKLPPNGVLEKLDQAQAYVSSHEGLLGAYSKEFNQHVEKTKEDVEYYIKGWPDNTKEWNSHLSAIPLHEMQTIIGYRTDEQLAVYKNIQGDPPILMGIGAEITFGTIGATMLAVYCVDKIRSKFKNNKTVT